MFKITKNDQIEIHCTKSKYQGKTYIHIREYYKGDNGEFIPTKKGVAMGEEAWDEFLDQMEKVIKGRDK